MQQVFILTSTTGGEYSYSTSQKYTQERFPPQSRTAQPRYMMKACKAPQSDIWRGASARFNVHLQPHIKGHAGAQHKSMGTIVGLAAAQAASARLPKLLIDSCLRRRYPFHKSACRSPTCKDDGCVIIMNVWLDC